MSPEGHTVVSWDDYPKPLRQRSQRVFVPGFGYARVRPQKFRARIASHHHSNHISFSRYQRDGKRRNPSTDVPSISTPTTPIFARHVPNEAGLRRLASSILRTVREFPSVGTISTFLQSPKRRAESLSKRKGCSNYLFGIEFTSILSCVGEYRYCIRASTTQPQMSISAIK